jgi:hypothetical protein
MVSVAVAAGCVHLVRCGTGALTRVEEACCALIAGFSSRYCFAVVAIFVRSSNLHLLSSGGDACYYGV